MRVDIKRIEAFIDNQKAKLLVIISLAVMLLVIRDVPFLNIFFPQNTIFASISVLTIVLFRLYKNVLFILSLAILTMILLMLRLNFQAEQTAILTFFVLSVFILEEVIFLLRNK